MLRLLTFGGLGLESDDGSAPPRLRPPRLALLAVLAAAGDRGVSRERLTGLLWPEADDQHASHSLRQARYALRNDLGQEVIRADGSVLSLDASLISSDISELHAALAKLDGARVVALARGAFLDGFYLPGAAAFERWVEEERSRVATLVTTALEKLAGTATAGGERDAAVQWWRELTIREPLSGRYAIGYLKSLGASGHRAEALTFARQHEALVRRELEADPDPEIRRLEAELRAMPSPAAPRVKNGSATQAVASIIGSVRQREETPAVIDGVPAEPRFARRRLLRRGVIVSGAAVVFMLTVTTALARQNGWFSRDSRPVLAVGLIHEDDVPDSQRAGGVLTDMLATNLARVEGLAVLANSRVLGVMEPGGGRDSSAAYANAARRAGASELIEGRLSGSNGSLELELRRVELRNGIVREVYRARAANRYALVDSVTQVVAHRFRLASPASSVAAATTASPTAYRLYEEGLKAYFQPDPKAAQRLMHAALEDDSTFAMAAYYEAVTSTELGADRLADGRSVNDLRRTALRLARRAPDGQRLMISANLLLHLQEPEALALAESLAMRFPDDPRALATLSRARWTIGDWSGSAQAIEGAIALDSAAEAKRAPICHLCQDFAALVETYMWWDSLPAAARTEQRAARLGLESGQWFNLAFIAARLGDSAAAYSAFRRSVALSGADLGHQKLRIQLTLGEYEDLEREVRPLLASSAAGEQADGTNALLLALRNEGRLRDAMELHQTGWLSGFPAVPRNPNDFDAGILAFERGDGRAAAAVFREKAHRLPPQWPGAQARVRTWNLTLAAMSLAAVGDTSAVKALIDSVEASGKRSAYGRDRKLHHYVRGLLLVARRQDEDAVREFRAAIHSPNLGFTRVNYELGRALLRLGRPSEAVGTLQSALRGEVDASNLYITRTDLHELLAQAFDAAGQPDSAAFHYRAVIRAWRTADPLYHARRAKAADWLASHVGTQASR